MSKHSKYEYFCPECKFVSVFKNPVERYLCAKCHRIIEHRKTCAACGYELSEGAVRANCCNYQAYWEATGEAAEVSKDTYRKANSPQ